MSNLQIYTWIGVPALTALVVVKNLLDFWHYRAIMARFDRFDAWRDRADSQIEQPLGKTTELDIR
jgi:hypothetical protein